MTPRVRTIINLAAVAAVAVVLLLYAFTQLLATALFDPTYPLSVRLPESGGLLPGQEVTVNGRVIGNVDDVDLDGESVLVVLAIEEGQRVPRDSDVVVLRRSSIGEQAIDFRPEHAQAGFYEPGDVIEALDATTPVAVQRLLSLADEVFGNIDPETAGDVVSEVATTVSGRSDDLRAIIRDSATFSEAIAGNADDIDTFFRDGRRVSAALADSRVSLARSIGEMADAAEVLVEMRSGFDRLLVEAPPTLSQVGGLVHRTQPNLACTIQDLGAINAHLARPEVLADSAEALRLNQQFFVGFNIVTPLDFRGNGWQRIHFLPPQEAPAESYLPDKRPIPPTLPGGACASPFGEGAPMATQAGFELVHPESRIIPPEDARAEPVRRDGPPLGRPSARPTDPDRPLPATGGHGLAFLLGAALLLAAGTLLRRRADAIEEVLRRG